MGAGVAAVWTLLVLIPVDPFDDMLSVVVAGGPGTWFAVGYLSYLAVGVAGFASLAAVIESVELGEGKALNGGMMAAGLVLLAVGVNATCLLLGLAGAQGGYAETISHVSGASLHSMLDPYVNVIRVTGGIAVVGAFASLAGIATARGQARAG